MSSRSPAIAPLSFGISAETGRPLAGLSEQTVRAAFRRPPVESAEALALRSRGNPANVAFGVQGDVDANDLSQAGWGVMFARGVSQEIRDALQPLLDHRRSQAQPFKIFENEESYAPGESAIDWLERLGVSLNVVDPTAGVPYYLLLVGSPADLPFEFQYTVDLYWGVGRLWFETAAEFRRYAESVVAYEKAAEVPTRRKAVLFATEHDFDAATQLFMNQVAGPIADPTKTPVWQRRKYALETVFGDRATKAGLAGILRGTGTGTPALLFSGSHGMEFKQGDPRQAEAQGALVCNDWEGFGKITEEHWFAGSDVPADARMHGMIHVLFACHGGGCPELDNYDRLNDQPKRIADAPFLSRLPQNMLAHPEGGALAVLAHVERAWAYNFQGQRGHSQIQGFVDVIARLLVGQPIGLATDQFNVRWAGLSTELSQAQLDLSHGVDVPTSILGNLWIARDDARNFIVLGDPAVRLRQSEMPVL